MASKAELEERLAELEQAVLENRKQDAAFMSLVGTIVGAVIVVTVGMVSWAVPFPGPGDELGAAAFVAVAFIVTALRAKSYLDTVEGDSQ